MVESKQIVLSSKEGKPYTTSALIANAFSRSHYDVLEKINQLKCSPEYKDENFKFTSYTDDSTGEKHPMYDISPIGFTWIAMKYTGVKATSATEECLRQFDSAHKAMYADRKITIPPTPLELANQLAKLLRDIESVNITYTEKFKDYANKTITKIKNI